MSGANTTTSFWEEEKKTSRIDIYITTIAFYAKEVVVVVAARGEGSAPTCNFSISY